MERDDKKKGADIVKVDFNSKKIRSIQKAGEGEKKWAGEDNRIKKEDKPTEEGVPIGNVEIGNFVTRSREKKDDETVEEFVEREIFGNFLPKKPSSNNKMEAFFQSSEAQLFEMMKVSILSENPDIKALTEFAERSRPSRKTIEMYIRQYKDWEAEELQDFLNNSNNAEALKKKPALIIAMVELLSFKMYEDQSTPKP